MRVLAIVLAANIAIAGTARAEEELSGLTEYELACMPCHGIDGHGDGPRAKEMSRPPADLTKIAKPNGGRFPAKDVAAMIDGRAAVAAHGPREMPVWGTRFRASPDTSEDAKTIETRARAQIAALVRYLEAIQEK